MLGYSDSQNLDSESRAKLPVTLTDPWQISRISVASQLWPRLADFGLQLLASTLQQLGD
jgi:hypothetical protein